MRSIDVAFGIPSFIRFVGGSESDYSVICATNAHSLQVYRVQDGQCIIQAFNKLTLVYPMTHGLDEDHSTLITDIAIQPAINLMATVSEDGMVKVWSLKENSLIRELPFTDQRISNIEFLNYRGDLIIGNDKDVLLVKMQNYLPPAYLKDFVAHEFQDDVVESGQMFDSSIDFWEIFLHEIDQETLNAWHTTLGGDKNSLPEEFSPEISSSSSPKFGEDDEDSTLDAAILDSFQNYARTFIKRYGIENPFIARSVVKSLRRATVMTARRQSIVQQNLTPLLLPNNNLPDKVSFIA